MTTALILAGRRDGTLDPLAAAAGVTHKCLVPVAHLPMLAHVAQTLAACPEITEIRVAIDNVTLVERIPTLHPLLISGRLRPVPARFNLVDSIIAAAEGAAFPLLVTTADNVLLSPQAVREFLTGAAGADAAVAFATRESVLAAHSDGQRRFYRFGDAAYSNCNSYWLRDASVLGVAEPFRTGGQFAKHPLRIAGAFGIANLIRFRFGIGTLADAFARFSCRFGHVLRPVILDDGAVAIDVDNDRTLRVVEEILARRAMPSARAA
jgi:GTP:adenosylcobinamide-phosphate guanylyltransferase